MDHLNMQNIKQYIEAQREVILEELFNFIRIPSITGNPDYAEARNNAAQFLKEALFSAGVDHAEIFETQGAPLVFGKKIQGAHLPTLLIYGHYDVMPSGTSPEGTEGWTSPPFEPEIRDGKIFARGADDDKGQLFMQLKAFEFLCKENVLACNVKFLFEGEEETGSAAISRFCEENKTLLHADLILVSDTGMIAHDIPSITAGLRGITYMEVEVSGPNRDLHSGLFGGAVANPAGVLCKMIASLHDENNRINIPGFYDDVLEYTPDQRFNLSRIPYHHNAYCESLGIDNTNGEQGYNTIERTGIRPALDVNGIWGGFTQAGTKTIIPATATAKISMRLVPYQQSEKIARLFEKHMLSLAPEGIKVKVSFLHGGEPYIAPEDFVASKAAIRAYEKTFEKSPVFTRSGGSIPIISHFEKTLGIKSILMGFGLESDAIHAPNENFPLQQFFKGIETIVWFYHFYVQEMHS